MLLLRYNALSLPLSKSANNNSNNNKDNNTTLNQSFKPALGRNVAAAPQITKQTEYGNCAQNSTQLSIRYLV